MVQSHSALGDCFWDSRPRLTLGMWWAPRAWVCCQGSWWSMSPLSLHSAACTGLVLTTAPCSTGAATGLNEQPWQVKGNWLYCGSRGVLWMFWISQKGVSTAHPSALEAEVGVTILKPSDTRSLNRGKRPHYLDRRAR